MGALSSLARTRLAHEAGLGAPYASLSPRYGLASPESVKVIVCRERKRLRIGSATPAVAKAPRPPSVWATPGIVARLTELWTRERLTKAQVARRLSVEFGVALNKHAVGGKVFRLGLCNREGASGAPARVIPNRAVITPAGGFVYRAGRVARELTGGVS